MIVPVLTCRAAAGEMKVKGHILTSNSFKEKKYIVWKVDLSHCKYNTPTIGDRRRIKILPTVASVYDSFPLFV
jgi:hypothetical protein